MTSPKHRPLGITIIAILTALSGIVFLISGAVGLLAPAISPEFGGVTGVVATIFLALGIPYLVVAYGVWKGRAWAWTSTLILSVIGIILAIVQIVIGNYQGGAINVIINGMDIYYLYRPNVKAFFGK